VPKLEDRVARVRLLLDTLNDYVPTPHGALRSDSGPAASRYVPCETCRRQGRVKSRSGLALCLICDGVGWKRREPGEAEWDAYVGLPVVVAAALPTMPAGSRAPVNEDAYGWEQARQMHERYGSYKELRRQLDRLRREHAERHRLVTIVLVDKDPIGLSPYHVAQLDLGVAQLAIWMKSVRVPPWLIERSEAAERRESITALAQDGYTAGEIARKLGVTKETVKRRLRRRNALPSGQAGIPERAM
jgi:hypothetical protein